MPPRPVVGGECARQDSVHPSSTRNDAAKVILAGRWGIFDDENFEGTKMAELGPGMYLRVQDYGIKDNRISSVRVI